MRRASGTIKRAEPLGHDALATEFAGVGKENVAVAFKNLVHDNSRMWTAYQFCQFTLALLDWSMPQVFAVQFDQVESVAQFRARRDALRFARACAKSATLAGGGLIIVSTNAASRVKASAFSSL